MRAITEEELVANEQCLGPWARDAFYSVLVNLNTLGVPYSLATERIARVTGHFNLVLCRESIQIVRTVRVTKTYTFKFGEDDRLRERLLKELLRRRSVIGVI